MVLIQALNAAQYVVDGDGQRTGVLLGIQEWEWLVNWIEYRMDVESATEAMLELKDSGGRPEKAGWLLWDDISEEWDEETK